MTPLLPQRRSQRCHIEIRAPSDVRRMGDRAHAPSVDKYTPCHRCGVLRLPNELDVLNGVSGKLQHVCRDFELCQRLASSVEEQTPKAEVIHLAEYLPPKDEA